MTTIKARFACMLVAASAVIMLAAAEAPATPPLEQLLPRAMETHPEIVAARANVDLAQAELSVTRLKVAREIISLYTKREALSQKVSLLTEQCKQGRMELQTLLDTKGQLEEIEAQWTYLVDQPVPSRTGSTASRQPTATPLPNTPTIAKIREALGQPSELDFIEQPLGDVCAFLSDYHHINIVSDEVYNDIPLTLTLGVRSTVTFAGALQGIEDQCPEVTFVVRDYGLWMTSPETAERKGAISAVEFAKQPIDSRDGDKAETIRAKDAPSSNPFGPNTPGDDPLAPNPGQKAKSADPFK